MLSLDHAFDDELHEQQAGLSDFPPDFHSLDDEYHRTYYYSDGKRHARKIRLHKKKKHRDEPVFDYLYGFTDEHTATELDHYYASTTHESSLVVHTTHDHDKHTHHHDCHDHEHEEEYHKHHKHHDHDPCAVCLEEDESPDCLLLPCAHSFHADCISQWVQTNFSCPLCRQKITQFMPIRQPGKKRSKKARKTLKLLERVWAEHYYADPSKDEDMEPESYADALKPTKTVHTEAVDTSVDCTDGTVTVNIKNEESCNSEKFILHKESEKLQSNVTKSGNSQTIEPVQLINNEKPEKIVIAQPSVESYGIWSKANDICSMLIPDWIRQQRWSVHRTEELTSPLTFLVFSMDLSTSSQTEMIDEDDGMIRFWDDASSSAVNGPHSSSSSSFNLYNHSLVYDDEPAIMQKSLKNGINNYDYHYHDKNNSYMNDDNLLKTTVMNAQAGLLAGMAASVGSLAAKIAVPASNEIALRHNPRLLMNAAHSAGKSLIPTMGLFFTSYEHLKTHWQGLQDHSDYNNDPMKPSERFARRMLCATVAGSFASSVVGKQFSPLGLRFGLFFGMFECLKDISLIRRNHQQPLNMTEVGICAGVGGTFASALYYPTTKLIAHIGNAIPNHNNNNINISSGGNGTMYLSKYILPKSVISNPSASLFGGFARYLAHFIPSCVACSCAFEFTRRQIKSRDKSED